MDQTRRKMLGMLAAAPVVAAFPVQALPLPLASVPPVMPWAGIIMEFSDPGPGYVYNVIKIICDGRDWWPLESPEGQAIMRRVPAPAATSF